MCLGLKKLNPTSTHSREKDQSNTTKRADPLFTWVKGGFLHSAENQEVCSLKAQLLPHHTKILTECILTTSCWNFVNSNTALLVSGMLTDLTPWCFPWPRGEASCSPPLGTGLLELGFSLRNLRVALSSWNLLLSIYNAILPMFFSPLGEGRSRNLQE